VGKKRIIKKLEQLSDELLDLIKKQYPDGYEDSLITFNTPKGEIEVGLPLETEDTIYMIKMPKSSIASEDDDDETPDPLAGSFESFDNLQIADAETETEADDDEDDTDMRRDEGDDGDDDDSDDDDDV
jgi:DNA-directed RNA polymerase subunit delta